MMISEEEIYDTSESRKRTGFRSIILIVALLPFATYGWWILTYEFYNSGNNLMGNLFVAIAIISVLLILVGGRRIYRKRE